MDKLQTRLDAFKFLGNFHPDIRTKFNNICGKTGQYNVPSELFQKRTHRKNRVLISWSTVKANNLTIEQLNSFSGGVAVELINEDYFLQENRQYPTFLELIQRIGSDDTVSAIISFRSETGSSSSALQRRYFEKLLNNTEVLYKGQTITINRYNYENYYLTRTITSGANVGIGNEKWSGFLFVSIKGGQQDVIESHVENITLFNPAVEFLNEPISLDLDLVMSYFAMHSVSFNNLTLNEQQEYKRVMSNLQKHLKESHYDSIDYQGNLLDYCNNHPSIMIGKKLGDNKLYDPIQVESIDIMDFSIKEKDDPLNLDFTHNVSVKKDRFIWDNAKRVILPPSKPTNVFWSKHLSNMM